MRETFGKRMIRYCFDADQEDKVEGLVHLLEGYFHWELEFPEVFVDLRKAQWLDDPGFDVVVGNPPWASIRGKHSSGIFDTSDMKYLEKKFPENTYMPNAFEYFISVSISYLNSDGFHSYIVPDRLGFNSSLEYLRQKLLNDYTLKELIYKLPFPGIIADTMVYIVTSKKHQSYELKVSEFGYTPININKDFYNEVGDTAFIFFENSEILSVIEKIDQNESCIEIGSVLKTTSGFGGKSELITKEKINDRQIAVLKGEDVIRYSIKSNHFFEFKDDYLTGRTRDEQKLSKKPKVLLRKTGFPLYAAIEDQGMYPEQSLYFLYDFPKSISPKITCAILNSKLFQFYYNVKLVTNRDSTPQLKNVHLDKFPIYNSEKILDLKVSKIT